MTKSIRSFKLYDQYDVVIRRLDGDTKGIGFWAAVDAARWMVAHASKMQLTNAQVAKLRGYLRYEP